MESPRFRSTGFDWIFGIACAGLFLAWVVFCAATDFGRGPGPPGERAMFAIMVAVLVVLFLAGGILGAVRADQRCAVCGRRFAPSAEPAPTASCPHCSQLSAVGARRRNHRAQAWAYSLRLVALLSIASGLYYVFNRAGQTGWSYWLFAPLATLVVGVWWLTVFFLPIVLVTAAKRQGLRNERYTLALARSIAGGSGAMLRDGPIMIWASGPSDSVPMLREQLEQVRGDYSRLIGRTIEPGASLRVYCFDGLRALERYHRQLSLATRNTGGGYIPAPVRMITVSLEGIVSRLKMPERWVRYLYGFYWLELDEGFLPPFWLREAVAHLLAARGDCQELDRLNRGMLASVRRGTALSADQLFQVQEKALVKPGRSWDERPSFTELSQWSPQSWSIGEYLFGGEATEERRKQSVEFLQDLNWSDKQEEVFLRRFGYGYEQLLEAWKKWVLERGEGTHAPPPAPVRDALLHEVIPTIRDSQRPLLDRIHAVRTMGTEGYALGADVLIDLLKSSSAIPREELIWALESISGLTLGDDVQAWLRWWEAVPQAAGRTAQSQQAT
jgi:hypothetical protein